MPLEISIPVTLGVGQMAGHQDRHISRAGSDIEDVQRSRGRPARQLPAIPGSPTPPPVNIDTSGKGNDSEKIVPEGDLIEHLRDLLLSCLIPNP